MIKIKCIVDKKYLPVKNHDTDSGYDLMANLKITEDVAKFGAYIVDEKVIVPPLKRVRINTGVKLEPPIGVDFSIRGRSGITYKHGVIVPIGTIDTDYRGYIQVTLINLSDDDFIINDGDRIAQLIVSRVEPSSLTIVDKLNETIRNDKGFGSSGIKTLNPETIKEQKDPPVIFKNLDTNKLRVFIKYPNFIFIENKLVKDVLRIHNNIEFIIYNTGGHKFNLEEYGKQIFNTFPFIENVRFMIVEDFMESQEQREYCSRLFIGNFGITAD